MNATRRFTHRSKTIRKTSNIVVVMTRSERTGPSSRRWLNDSMSATQTSAARRMAYLRLLSEFMDNPLQPPAFHDSLCGRVRKSNFFFRTFSVIPLSSEQYLKPETKHCRRVDAGVVDPRQYEPRGDADLVFLSPSDDLQVRRKQQPWGDRGIVESLEPILVPQKFPRLNESLKRRVIDVDVVVPQAELVQRPALEHTLAADPKTAEEFHEVGIAVGNP